MAPPKNPWFRLYGVEMMADPKIRALKVEHRWLWIAVLTLAGASPIPGLLLVTESLPVTERDLAATAGLHWRTVRAGMAALLDLGLIEADLDRDTWRVKNWDKRQFRSDRSTERVTRLRRLRGA